MKTIKNILKLSLALIMVVSINACQDEDQEFGEITTPTNLQVNFELVGADTENPNGDGSGAVTFTASADDALSYRYNFGDETALGSAPNGGITHMFTETGLNTYEVTVIASGTGGNTTSTTVSVNVFSNFNDQEAKDFLTGGAGSSKTWYWADSKEGHLGVGPTLPFDLQINGGPLQHWFPAFFAAVPGGVCGGDPDHCLCSDELIFSLDVDNQLNYQLNNNGETFFNGSHQAIVGGDGSADACFAFDTSGSKVVSLAPSTTDWSQVGDPNFTFRGTVMNFSDDGFMGYYVASSSYEILELSDTEMYVRTIDGLSGDLAWYHRFTTTPPGEDDDPGEANNCEDGGATGDTGNGDLQTLVWADEFDVDGAPCDTNWGYELGDGCPNLCGWGNNEQQFYTDDPSNVIVEDGLLKITARKEQTSGYDYSSSRLTTQDLFEFQYGRVEVRAKLPTGEGTWPAIWMFGADYETNPWPGCGEIDMMEHVGVNQNVIIGALHYPGNAGGNADVQTTVEPTASTEFHVYSIEWDANRIDFFIDGVQFRSFNNNTSVPFNHTFFLRLNVAMGGTLGGAIDPNFTESTFEIDYVRVYQ